MSPSKMASRLVDESRAELAWRRGKQLAHQARRLALWAAKPERWPRPLLAPSVGLDVLVALRTVDLARADPDADPRLEEGKRHNVRLAAPAFDGLWVTPERPLSFWRTLGRLSERAGFRYGLSLRGGCLTPSVGGGICLLANALFELAARQGWHVLERHGHTLEAVPAEPGTLWGMDATVAWPYVDLVVAPREGPVRLGARVDGERLRLTLHASAPPRTRSELWSEDERTEVTPAGQVRTNRVVRRVVEVSTGAVLEQRSIAENRRRMLRSDERRRTCLTCGEDSCHARVELPRAEVGT